ncbi:MAG: hypothetical protein JWL72_3158 [Ilumatobacteraceae bacterium]|nr:hypothetical protein [Ilumatobacteraceae bacterium]
MSVRMSRADLRKPLGESAGWEVYDFLESRLDQASDMGPVQRAVLALGDVHHNCQWEGVYGMLNNVDPTTIISAVDAATLLGRDDMAAALRRVITMVPVGFDPPDHARVVAWASEHLADSAVRSSFEVAEVEWDEYGLALDEFIERHANEFFLDG